MGLSRVFEISRRSLATYQNAIDITSHNVANVSNANYSRQKVSFVAETPEKNANFIWGSGVTLDEIQRVRSQLVDSQLRNSYGTYSSNEQTSVLLSEIEQVFSEPTELGLSNMITEFLNGWSELSVTANSSSIRYNIVQNAKQLNERMQIVYDNLNAISYDAMRSFADKTESVNTMLQQIQQLNIQIVDSGAVGLSANDLMDSRDTIIDELSKLVNINVIYDSNNAANISIGGIQSLDTSSYVEFDTKVVNNKLTLVTKDGNVAVKLSGGELYGISDVYSNKIPEYLSSLDQIANTIVSEVNALHSKGYSLEDPPVTGINFFDGYSSGTFIINPDILDDVTKIAVSADGSMGDGSIASKISNLQFEKIVNGLTLNESYAKTVSKLGSDKQSADKIVESTGLVIEQLNKQKGSISGVSLDEEMTNIIRFQRSYDASARLITIADEMLNTLIQMV